MTFRPSGNYAKLNARLDQLNNRISEQRDLITKDDPERSRKMTAIHMLRTYTAETALEFAKASLSGQLDEIDYHYGKMGALNRKLDALERELEELGM